MKTLRIVFLMITLLLPSAVLAAENCWGTAGQRYHFDPWLLYLIAQKESRLNPNAIAVNSDGSRDYGMMQINSFWLPKLAPYGNTAEVLVRDVCTNINIGAWILSLNFQSHGRSWDSVGI